MTQQLQVVYVVRAIVRSRQDVIDRKIAKREWDETASTDSFLSAIEHVLVTAAIGRFANKQTKW